MTHEGGRLRNCGGRIGKAACHSGVEGANLGVDLNGCLRDHWNVDWRNLRDVWLVKGWSIF